MHLAREQLKHSAGASVHVAIDGVRPAKLVWHASSPVSGEPPENALRLQRTVSDREEQLRTLAQARSGRGASIREYLVRQIDPSGRVLSDRQQSHPRREYKFCATFDWIELPAEELR